MTRSTPHDAQQGHAMAGIPCDTSYGLDILALEGAVPVANDLPNEGVVLHVEILVNGVFLLLPVSKLPLRSLSAHLVESARGASARLSIQRTTGWC